jgi:hypothetical protein
MNSRLHADCNRPLVSDTGASAPLTETFVMNTRIATHTVRHTYACGRLLAIQINRRPFIKHRGARSLPSGGARVTCDGCKRPTSFTTFDLTRP